MDEIGRQLRVRIYNNWVPIHLKTGVEYDKVLEDVVSQLKVIAKIAGSHLTGSSRLPEQVPDFPRL